MIPVLERLRFLVEGGENDAARRKREVTQRARETAMRAFPDGRGSNAAVEHLTNAHTKRAMGAPLRVTQRFENPTTIPVSNTTFKIDR